MSKSGMTRRIDELGRLVIPKEIRKNLKIRDNDQIEINILDDKIVLSKYNVLKKDDIIHQLLLCMKKILNKSVIFTSREKIVDFVLVNSETLDNEELSDEIMRIIESRKQVVDNNKYIKPLIIHGDLYGSLILISNDIISEADTRIVRFVEMFLENYLE